MTLRKFSWLLVPTLVIAVAGGYAAVQWRLRSTSAAPDAHDHGSETEPAAEDESAPVRLSPQARKNLGIKSVAAQPTTYWRKMDLPGIISDRPGISDRGVVAPVTGIVTQIHAYIGDTVAPNAPLFSLRLVSESLHTSQLELFKATKEIEIARQQKTRLGGLTQSGGVAGSRIIDIDNQIQRMDVQAQAYRQDLLARGLSTDRIDAAAKGDFVTEVVVRAPGEQARKLSEFALASALELEPAPHPRTFNFELQSLKVELGQQVEAGGVLCYLADHRILQIEGRGFKRDLSLVQQAARNELPIEVAFDVDENTDWPPLPRQLHIHHVASLIDAQSRTFTFYLPLENQWQSYVHSGQDRTVWRFRPGDRVRLSVAVEKIDNVFVVPRAAVMREGPEAFVFRQNGDLFDRRPVHVLLEDSRDIVFANDGSVLPSSYLAQSAAASLNRVLKSQSASGKPAGVHVHADGSVHGAH